MKQNSLDENYLKLVERIKNEGIEKSDRTGTGTISLFGTSLRHKMSEGFPLLTSKQMSLKSVAAELIWFLKGSTDIRDLWEMKCYIWDGDWYKHYKANKNGQELHIRSLEEIKRVCRAEPDLLFDLGPIYGKQWRDFNGVDQISNLIKDIKENPDSRRLMVNAWNVSEIDNMVLPPCHYGFQCYTKLLDNGERELSLMWNQRSVDTLLGLPYNLASYGLLLLILCRETNCVPGELIANLGDTHIYLDQLPFVEQQLTNETFKLPTVEIQNYTSFGTLTVDNFKLNNYKHGGRVQYPLSN